MISNSPSVPVHRYAVLDGWRAVSILLVMAGHLLPLGPKYLQLNATVAALGMAMFFSLSGFLILTTLLENLNVRDFFVRRMLRILPLYIVFILAVGIITGQNSTFYWMYLLFTENFHLPAADAPHQLAKLVTHLWSLCVEVHFYIFIGAWVGFTKLSAVWIVPLLLCAITVAKLLLPIPVGDETAQTFWRVDEILAGATVALMVFQRIPPTLFDVAKRIPILLVGLLLAATCHPVMEAHGALALRPYFALLLIGQVIERGHTAQFAILRSRPARYIASISYALYVLHLPATAGWLGEGDSKLIIYAKRPLCFALAWAGAHLSTRYLETPIVRWGRRLIARRTVVAV